MVFGRIYNGPLVKWALGRTESEPQESSSQSQSAPEAPENNKEEVQNNAEEVKSDDRHLDDVLSPQKEQVEDQNKAEETPAQEEASEKTMEEILPPRTPLERKGTKRKQSIQNERYPKIILKTQSEETTESGLPMGLRKAMDHLVNCHNRLNGECHFLKFPFLSQKTAIDNVEDLFRHNRVPKLTHDTTITSAAIVYRYLDQMPNPLVPPIIWNLPIEQQNKATMQPLIGMEQFEIIDYFMKQLTQYQKNKSVKQSFADTAELLVPSLTHQNESAEALQTVTNFLTNCDSVFK